jgi:hypothetical protein
MIRIGEDQETIYITRGDQPTKEFNRLAFYYPIYNFATEKEENYVFQLDDKITFAVVNKKGYTKEEIFKKDYTLRDLGYVEPTETVEIPITSEDTKEFPLLNKKATYWFDIILNDTTTILGYDDEGAKKIIVFPEVEEE